MLGCAESSVHLFADDGLFYKVISMPEDSEQLRMDLQALENWWETSLMSFNHTKYSVIRITLKHRRAEETTYKLHGHTLAAQSKYLGFTMFNNLTWNKHIENIASKGNRTFGFIRRNLKDCTLPIEVASCTILVCLVLEYSFCCVGSNHSG